MYWLSSGWTLLYMSMVSEFAGFRSQWMNLIRDGQGYCTLIKPLMVPGPKYRCPFLDDSS